MADRRMFSQKIVESDDFTELPIASQSLYFHLNMVADDDGFVNNPRRVRLSIDASEADMAPLIQKGYIIQFESGVVCVTHWLIHNSIRKDRYVPTIHQTLMSRLRITNKIYTLANDSVATIGQPNYNQMATTRQPNGNPGKDRLGEIRIGEESVDEVDTLASELGLPLPLIPKANDWLAYKMEQGKTYAQSSIKSILASMKRNAEQYGVDAVAELIELCITRGWKGIIYDRLAKKQDEMSGTDGEPASNRPAHRTGTYL